VDATKQIKIKKPSNLSAFFICLLIATALWLLHSLNTVYTQRFKIPVEFTNYPQNKTCLSELPKELQVSVKTSGMKLLLISLNEPFPLLKIDFNEVRSDLNRNKFYLSSNNSKIQKLFNIKTEIKGIYPDTIAFANKFGTQKEVFVKVPLNIKYAQGFTASDVNVNPGFVLVNGDAKDLELIDTVYTEPVFLNGINADVNRNIFIKNSNSKLVLSTNAVQLSISVSKLVGQEIVLPIQVENKEDGYDYSIFPSKVKIKFTATLDKKSIPDSLLFKVYVNSKQKKNNKLPVNVSALDNNITIMSIEPKEIEFLMIRKK